MVPSTLLAWVSAINLVLRRYGLAHGIRIDGAAAIGLKRVSADLAGQLHRPQRPADAVVFEVGGDDVIALAQHALEGHVERVGAIEREDEPLLRLAVEEVD